MDSKYIHSLIKKFFENNLPEEIQYKFHKWFVGNESFYEKTNVMLDIWERCPAEQTETTEEELRKIHKQNLDRRLYRTHARIARRVC